MKYVCVFLVFSQTSILSTLRCLRTLTLYVPSYSSASPEMTCYFCRNWQHWRGQSALLHYCTYAGYSSNDSIFHLVCWELHRLQQPVRSAAAAEILVDNKALDEIDAVCDAVETILVTKIRLTIIIDSHDLCSSLASHQNSTDRSYAGTFTH